MTRRDHGGWLLMAVAGLPLIAMLPDTVFGTAAADILFEATAPYYLPPRAVVAADSPVRWINATASHHSVRHDGCLTGEACLFQSIAVPPDSSLMIAPLPPGQYPYHCELHPIMRGTLIVEGSGGEERSSSADRLR